MGLVMDPVPIESFVQMPSDSAGRRIPVGRFGVVDVFVLDPYMIALSKLDRGFDSDVADIVFLVQQELMSLDRLTDGVAAAAAHAAAFDLDPSEMQRHLAVVRQRIANT
jgi:hypothetical protein